MTAGAFQRAPTAYCGQQPFRPFVLVFSTGESVTVTHPEAIEFSADEPDDIGTLGIDYVIYRDPKGGFRVFDASSVNQLMDEPQV
jgi:hypothetical protein